MGWRTLLLSSTQRVRFMVEMKDGSDLNHSPRYQGDLLARTYRGDALARTQTCAQRCDATINQVAVVYRLWSDSRFLCFSYLTHHDFVLFCFFNVFKVLNKEAGPSLSNTYSLFTFLMSFTSHV